MKKSKFLMAALAGLTLLSACKKEGSNLSENVKTADDIAIASDSNLQLGERGGWFTGHVYTLSNQTTGNQLLDYKRGTDGKLTYLAAYATGGNGSGGGLGNQGAVILSEDGEELYAVNAGSNSISAFKVSNNGLRLISTIASGGTRPVSITASEKTVFVLNAGGDGNIAGFRSNNGRLRAIAHSIRPLSSTASGAAQIAFVKNGKVLAITEKATNKIITYKVNENGIPGDMNSIVSANPTPFGFAVGRNGRIFVSEAAGGAPNASTLSSYNIENDGSISLVTGPVATNQSAACWVVLSGDFKYAWTTNTASNTISTFDVTNSGGVSLASSVGATTGMGPIDAAVSKNSKYLYVLNSMSNSISAYKIDNSGTLTNIQTVTGLVSGDNGLAAQ